MSVESSQAHTHVQKETMDVSLQLLEVALN